MRSGWLVVIGTLLATGCGSDGDHDARRDTEEASVTSFPFAFDPDTVPAGYQLATAGRGDDGQAWGDDSVGTDEPFTVLAPPGEDATSDEVVVVSVTGFEGYEGGLGQAALGNHSWDDVVEERGDDLAVRAATPGPSTEEELYAIADRVEPDDDHARAPTVDRAGDLEMIGSVDADAVIALSAGFEPFSGDVPGPEGSHGVGWLAEGEGSLSVMTLRGDAADLDALPAIEAFSAGGVEVAVLGADAGDRPALVLESTFTGVGRQPWTQRSVVGHAPSGQLVVVVASGPTVPEAEELLALLSSVGPTEAGAWDRFVVEATGGPGLVPDPGAVEVARGTQGGVDWLLQAWPDAGSAPPRGGGEAFWAQGERPGPVVDGCLKLSTRERACTSGGGSEPGYVYEYAPPGANSALDFPPFVIVETESAGDAVRVTSDAGIVTVDLQELAGSDRRVAVAFADLGAVLPCAQSHRVEVLDSEGAVVTCLGD